MRNRWTTTRRPHDAPTQPAGAPSCLSRTARSTARPGAERQPGSAVSGSGCAGAGVQEESIVPPGTTVTSDDGREPAHWVDIGAGRVDPDLAEHTDDGGQDEQDARAHAMIEADAARRVPRRPWTALKVAYSRNPGVELADITEERAERHQAQQGAVKARLGASTRASRGQVQRAHPRCRRYPGQWLPAAKQGQGDRRPPAPGPAAVVQLRGHADATVGRLPGGPGTGPAEQAQRLPMAHGRRLPGTRAARASGRQRSSPGRKSGQREPGHRPRPRPSGPIVARGGSDAPPDHDDHDNNQPDHQPDVPDDELDRGRRSRFLHAPPRASCDGNARRSAPVHSSGPVQAAI